jgi:para-nitrobenzyl esterase
MGMASALALGFSGGAQAGESTATAAVETTSGKVRGKRIAGVSTFLGIPYGADTGTRRFLPPVPPTPWSAVRECLTLGHQSPQMDPTPNAASGADMDLTTDFVKKVRAAGREGVEVGNEGEDCLVLNLYTPDASGARRRPVMVWLHGGGYSMGSAGDPQYDGSALARRGDVVVVAINHRLNALGFLYLGALHNDFADSGNAGMLDIVLALDWVRDNIANFGGDPKNVTIFGESGGGSKVSHMLAIPKAQGLYHKAIIQSGAALVALRKEKAAEHAERTLAKLGVAPADVHKLQSMDIRQIIAAAAGAQARGEEVMRPVIDDRTLSRDPFTPDAPDISRGVPVMVGTTKDEAALFMSADPLFGKMSEEQARERAGKMLGSKGNAAIDVIKDLRPSYTPTYWVAALATAQGAWTKSIQLAERKFDQRTVPVYMYRLDWEAPFEGGALKSPHGLDTPLVFDNAQARPKMNGTGPEPKAIAATMSKAWVNFARSGDPSQRGLPWPKYDTTDRKTMIFNVSSHVVSDPDRALRLMLIG